MTKSVFVVNIAAGAQYACRKLASIHLNMNMHYEHAVFI